MGNWAGIALALRGPRDDAMESRLPTYLHPLAGRALAWHVLDALAALDPPPHQLLLIATDPLDPAVVGTIDAEVVSVAPGADWMPDVAARLAPDVGRVLMIDAAAATVSASLAAFIAAPEGRALVTGNGEPVAVWLARAAAADRAGRNPTLAGMAQGCEQDGGVEPDEVFVVRDRATLARAGSQVRGRVIRRLMAEGVTFLHPESVLVDVDVSIGPDTVIYPGVVIEGETRIGAETVIGPSCRLIDAQIGSGVELKGWNYISGSSIRNRAVLEPYVRRGFD